MTKQVAVAWQMRWARQLPDGSYAEWHTISKEKYDWAVKNADPGEEYRSLCLLTTSRGGAKPKRKDRRTTTGATP